MPTPPQKLVPGKPAAIYLQGDTVTALIQYRRGDERPDETVARLIRFVRRFLPAAEDRVREEFLP
jgi:hypothetical protein